MAGVPDGQAKPEITADLMFPCGRRQLALYANGCSDYTVYTDEQTYPKTRGYEDLYIRPDDEPLKSAETVELWVDN